MQNNMEYTRYFGEEMTHVGHDVPTCVAQLASDVVQSLARSL